jgi:hypothetical protein
MNTGGNFVIGGFSAPLAVNVDSFFLQRLAVASKVESQQGTKMVKLPVTILACLLGTAANGQTFNYVNVDTTQFNAAMTSAFSGTRRPPGYGYPLQFEVQRNGNGFIATILLADDTLYYTGWNRVNPHGNSLKLLESDSLTDLASQTDALGAQFNTAGATWYTANFAAVAYGNKVRYFQLVAQD